MRRKDLISWDGCLQASVALRRLESFLLAKEVAERPLDGGTLAEPCEDSQGSIPQLPVLHNLDLVRYFHSRNAGPLIDNGLPLAAIEGGDSILYPFSPELLQSPYPSPLTF